MQRFTLLLSAVCIICGADSEARGAAKSTGVPRFDAAVERAAGVVVLS